MAFTENSDPIDDMRIGMAKVLEDWLNKTQSPIWANPNYKVDLRGGIYVITGKGNMVLENFDIPEYFKDKIEFQMDGNVTIISKLSPDDIYKRMRDICRGILEIPTEVLEKQAGSLTEERIERCKEYILGLPYESTVTQKVELLNSVKGILEFASGVSDNFGINLRDYAKIFKARLN